jgi:uncharacterized protein YyaL (SSP411 family)
MLYDQAQLAWAYLDGYRIARTGGAGDAGRAADYAETARGIFEYVTRELTAPEGAFYSAEDADSEGEEGRFYVWRPSEIGAVLGADAEVFMTRYDVTERGNFEHGASILHESRSIADVAGNAGSDSAEVVSRLRAARAKLLEARSRRVRPHRDDKVLTSWNGLMISAYARGARTFADHELAKRAERAATFVWDRMRDRRSGALARRWRDGDTGGEGQLDDYAYFALGLLDLYQATFDPVWLERARETTEQMIDRFWDDDAGGFFESPAGDPYISVRMKDDFDGAELAGNSVAAAVLHTLAELGDREDWRARTQRLFAFYAARLHEHPVAMPQMLVAMDLASAPARHVVLAGEPGSADLKGLVAEFDRRFLPRDFLLVAPGGSAQKQLAKIAPFVAPLVQRDGRATAYVCVDRACRLPTTDPLAFGAQFDAETHRIPEPESP